jgi:hypothetical protein
VRQISITVNHPITDDEIKAEVLFYFTPFYPATSSSPAEPPNVEIIDILANGESVGNIFTYSQIKNLEGYILEMML